MKKIILIISSVFLLLTVSACSELVTEAPAVEQAQTQRLTVVSSGKPAEALPAFTTFAWNEQYNLVLSAVSEESEAVIKGYIRKQIITYLKNKGYQYQPDPAQADVVIGFLFALEDDIADRSIQEKFGLLPGLHKNSALTSRYEKGTFLLSVLDANLKTVYWRSAMQGFVDLEKDRSEPSSPRMQIILQSMMGGFPEAGR